jgi:hypothetical protein
MIVLLSVTMCGCEPRNRSPDSPPPEPTTAPVEPHAAEAAASEEPKRPENPWAVFVEAAEAEQDADIVAKWTGGNRLEIRTTNVMILRLDLTRLPEGAPERPPWNLQIDGQGIEITGRRGLVIDLVRSSAGRWSVAGPPAD